MDVAKLVELVFRPPLKLLFREAPAEKQLTDRMGPRMPLLQRVVKIIDQFFGGQ
jgi:hypothetical protein